MTRKQKKMLVRIFASAVLLIAAVLIPYEGALRFLLFLPAYFVIGWDVLWRAAKNIIHGQVFDENFLMALATVGAFCTGFFGKGEYPEAVFVMLFYQVGELFQSYAVGKSRKSISALMDIRPDYANVERDGSLCRVDPEEVQVGDVIVIKPGEKAPLDGVVLEGRSSLNTSALTGESLPREVEPGDDVISGCINLNGLIRVQVTKVFGESTVAKILDLVENSSSKKAKAENFITKFARYYTPIVVVSAVLLAVAPPLFTGGNWAEWIERALIFLVVSCPCALVISCLLYTSCERPCIGDPHRVRGKGGYASAGGEKRYRPPGSFWHGRRRLPALYAHAGFSQRHHLHHGSHGQWQIHHPVSGAGGSVGQKRKYFHHRRSCGKKCGEGQPDAGEQSGGGYL